MNSVEADDGMDFVDELEVLQSSSASDESERNSKETSEVSRSRSAKSGSAGGSGSRRRRRSRRRPADWERSRGDFLLFPFRVLNNFLNHWGFGESLSSGAYRARRLLRSATRFEGRDVARKTVDGELVLSRVPTAKTLANPIWWCIWTVQFPWLWLISRPFLGMVLAIPALVFLGYCTYVVNAGRSMAFRAGSFVDKVTTSLEAEEFDQARFYGDLMVQNNLQSGGVAYFRAGIEQEAGDREAGEAFMRHAAELGHGPAALWLADNVGDRRQLANWPEQDLEEYERWLNVALDSEVDPVLTTKALAELKQVRGDLKKSYEMLLTIEDSDPSLATLLVAMEKELGLEEQAETRASAVVDANLATLEDVPELVSVRIQTAKLLVFLDKPIDAARLLLRRSEAKGISKAEFEALRRPIADGLVIVANRLAKQDKSPRGLMRRLEYLRKALQYDPTSRPVLDAVVQASLEVADSDDDELAVMQEAIVRGVSTDAAHFILGTVALQKGDVEQAVHHLDIAAESNPNLPGVLNNLAYAMVQQEEPDLEKALRLADAAVRATSGNAYACETRGQILLRLGRWNEAISDLEVALKEDALKRLVRPSLAKAYEEIGRSEIAARHRELHSKGM